MNPTSSNNMNTYSRSLSQAMARLEEMQKIITSFLYRIDTDDLDWASIIELFVLIDSMTKATIKIFSTMGFNSLSKLSIVPIKTFYEVDEVIHNLTHGRLQIFTHEIIPVVLKTKFIQQIEETVYDHDEIIYNQLENVSFKSSDSNDNDDFTATINKAIRAYKQSQAQLMLPSQDQKPAGKTDTDKFIGHKTDSEMKMVMNYMEYAKPGS